MAKRTPTERERKHICDFSRCVLNTRLRARIQTLLRGHKYAFFLFQWADFGCGQNYYLLLECFEGLSVDCDFLWLGFQKIDTQIIVVISRKFIDFPIILCANPDWKKVHLSPDIICEIYSNANLPSQIFLLSCQFGIKHVTGKLSYNYLIIDTYSK